MGISKLRLMKVVSLGGMDSRMLAAMISALPVGTKLAGFNETDLFMELLFENRIFKDGTELIANFRRDIAIIGEEIVDVDHFMGLDLKECLRRDK